MVRPGRLDKLLYVDLPNEGERIEILNAQTKKTPMGLDVDLSEIARDPKADGLSGADLSALVREAAVSALREVFDKMELRDEDLSVEMGEEERDKKMKVPSEGVVVEMRHFRTALVKTSPSVSVAQRKRFEMLRLKFAGQPVGHAKEGRGSNRPAEAGGAGEADVALT